MTLCSIIYLGFFLYSDSEEMRTILAIVVISCFFVVASSQFDCLNRASQLASCLNRVGQSTDTESFCNDCGNSLIRYYNDCLNGVGVDGIKQSKVLQLIILIFAARLNNCNNVTQFFSCMHAYISI